jgi:hypothetical protein
VPKIFGHGIGKLGGVDRDGKVALLLSEGFPHFIKATIIAP